MRPKLTIIAAGLVAAFVAALPVRAADADKPAVPLKLNVKLGLWEIAMQANINGMPPIPDEMMAKLTPEQRTRMQAAMQASMADVAKPKLARNCVTAEKLARGMDLASSERHDCERRITTNTSSEFQISMVCKDPEGTMQLDEHFQLSGSLLGGSEQLAGTAHMVRTAGGKTMTVDSNIKGQWLGASCGDVKDYQLEK